MDGSIVEALGTGLSVTTFLVGFSSVRLRAQRDRALSRSDAAASELTRAGAADRAVTDAEVESAASAFAEADQPDPIGRWTVIVAWGAAAAMAALLAIYRYVGAPAWQFDPRTWQSGTYVAIFMLTLSAVVALLGTADYRWVSADLRKRLDNSVPRLAAAAIQLQRDKKPDEAMIVARHLATKAPSWPWVHIFIAHLHSAADRTDEALSACTHAITLDPSNPWWRVARAEIHLTRENWSAALEDLEGIGATLPGDARVSRMLGAALYGTGRRAEAIAAFGKSLKTAPGDTNVHIQRGRALIDTAETRHLSAPSAALIEILLDDGGKVALDAISRVGRTRLNAHDTAEAIRDFTFAIERDPSNADAFAWRGTAKIEAGDDDGAAADFGDAARLGFDEAKLETRRAVALRRVGRYVDAEAALSVAISLAPSKERYRRRAFTRHGLGRPKEALADFESALQYDPNDSDLRAHRAALLMETGRSDEGASEFEELERSTPASVHDYGIWAEALHRNGQTQAASEVIDRGVQRCAADERRGALFALSGSIHASLRLYRRALDDFAAAEEAGCPPGEVPYRRALCLASMGDGDAALLEISLSAESPGPFQYGALATRATMHRNRGDADAAIIDLDRAIALAPHASSLYVARGCLVNLAYGDARRARADFDLALSLSPDDVPALQHRLRTFDPDTEIPAAEADLIRIGELIGADGVEYLKSRASLLSHQRRYDEVADVYRRILEIAPGDRDALWSLGAAYDNGSNFIDAEAVFRELVSKNSGDVPARLSLAVSLSQQGRSNEAIAEFGKARISDEKKSGAWMTRSLRPDVLPEYGRVMADWAASEPGAAGEEGGG